MPRPGDGDAATDAALDVSPQLQVAPSKSSRLQLAKLEGGVPHEAPYVFAVTGRAWAALREHFPLLLPRICCRGAVFARMSSDQKQQLVNELQDLGYYVGACRTLKQHGPFWHWHYPRLMPTNTSSNSARHVRRRGQRLWCPQGGAHRHLAVGHGVVCCRAAHRQGAAHRLRAPRHQGGSRGAGHLLGHLQGERGAPGGASHGACQVQGRPARNTA